MKGRQRDHAELVELRKFRSMLKRKQAYATEYFRKGCPYRVVNHAIEQETRAL